MRSQFTVPPFVLFVEFFLVFIEIPLSLCRLPTSVIDLTAHHFICPCGCRDPITSGLFCTAAPVAKFSKHIPP